MKLEKHLIITRAKAEPIESGTILYTDPENLLINPFFSTDKGGISDEALAYKKYLWHILNNPTQESFEIHSLDDDRVKGLPIGWIHKQPSNYQIYSLLHKIADDIRSLAKVQLLFFEHHEIADILVKCIAYLVNNPQLHISNQLIHGDLLSIPKGLIVQNVNCQKKMGAGLALAIKNKYPQVHQEYIDKPIWELGDTQFVEISKDLVFCNLAGQKFYGTNKRQSDFIAIENGLNSVQKYAMNTNLHIYIPFGFASGKAGGSTLLERHHTWKMVQKSIHRICPEAVIVFKELK